MIRRGLSSTRNRRDRFAPLAGAILAVAIASVMLGVSALASGPIGGSDFRISNVHTDGDAARDGFEQVVAYNSTANEYLVVWDADGLATDDEFEIFGQRVSAAGAEVGADFRISNVGTDGVAARDGKEPAVAYNSTDNEYLVTWYADGGAADDALEIYGQRISAAGAEVGGDFQISNAGASPVGDPDAFDPAVAYNATADEYLVAWRADQLIVDGDNEIFGQRVSDAGAEVGTDFRISNVGTEDSLCCGGFDPSIAWNSTANEYLVSWDGSPTGNNEFEISGQLVSAVGAEVGTDFRISTMGTDGDPTRDAAESEVTYNATANEYLVTWQGDPFTNDDEFEIFGQRVSAVGAEVGADFRISNVGTDGDAGRDARVAEVAWNSTANEYLVSFLGDAFPTDDEFEILGQDLSAAGLELDSDFRISNVGTDGDATHGGFDPQVAYNPTANEYLVAWGGDGLLTDGETEVFGRRVDPTVPSTPIPPPPGPPGPPPPPPPPPERFPPNLLAVPEKIRTICLPSSNNVVKCPVPITVPAEGIVSLQEDKPSASSAAKKKTQTKIKPATVTATQAGVVTVQLTPTKAGTKLLRQKGKMKVNLVVAFTPTGGTPNSTTTSATFTLKKSKK